MNLLLSTVLGLLLVVVTQSLLVGESSEFTNFVLKVGRKFLNSNERQYRQGIFSSNLAKIKMHNADPTRKYNQGVNEFTDRTKTELERNDSLST
jgi:hypothetical protein